MKSINALFQKSRKRFDARAVASSTSVLLGLRAFLLGSCTEKSSFVQPTLGTRSAQFLKVGGFQFKDLNKNGTLDKYEDWRLTPEERSVDLLARMSVEEKAGFMLINSLSMLGSRKAKTSNGEYQASDLDEGQVKDDRPTGGGNFIGAMNAATSTTQRVKEFHNRHFILRLNEGAGVIAEWNNKLQELCESEPLGIPAIITSNPRNHISSNASVGTALNASVFTAWPGELGLSATRDLSLIREFANDSRQEWLAAGIRKGYMYMADLSTEPRWSRVDGTFGENPEWVAKVVKEIVIGFQGTKLDTNSIALTMKHFPGGGSGKDGQDSHFDWGKEQVYPGGRFYDNILPFQAAIDAGTSAIMPYYSMPVGTEFEEVGYSFNKEVITGVLREKMGFSGIINTDTGPITRMVWGVEKLSVLERYQKALEAGSNIISGMSDPADLLEVINKGMVDMSLIDNSVLLLLKEKFTLGIFENPYVNVDAAKATVGSDRFREKAAVALRKSIVMLRNEKNTLPIKAGSKIYVETLQSPGRGEEEGSTNFLMETNGSHEVEFVKTLAEADLAIQWIIPSNSVFNSNGEPISISLSTKGIDVGHIKEVIRAVPTLLVIDYSNPWVINEIYDDKNKGNVVGVFATFGTTPEALLDVITGKFNPAGKMPFSTPFLTKRLRITWKMYRVTLKDPIMHCLITMKV